jgi:CspA family cold shock protein
MRRIDLGRMTGPHRLQGVHVSDTFSKNRRTGQGRERSRAKSHLYRYRRTFYVNKGTVKWFNNQKGFGFIQPETGGTDVFVHISAVERAGMSTLNEGQKISFDVVADRRTGKSAAENLRAA